MIVGVPKDHPTTGDTGLTLTEAQSHFSMWCMFPTILMATNDVRLRDPDIERILLNNETMYVRACVRCVRCMRGTLSSSSSSSSHAGTAIPTDWGEYG